MKKREVVRFPSIGNKFEGISRQISLIIDKYRAVIRAVVQKQSVVAHFDDLARWLQNRNRPPASLFDWPFRCNVRWKSVRNCRLPIFVLLQPERTREIERVRVDEWLLCVWKISCLALTCVTGLALMAVREIGIQFSG